MIEFRQPEHMRDQLVLYEQKLDQVIPLDHPVRNFDQIMSAEVFKPVYEEMRGGYKLREGRPPYDPAFLTKLYIYGILNRIRSSRKLEEACRNRIDVIWLMCGQKPDHTTISNFFKHHKDQLKQLLAKTVLIAIRADLISFKMLGIDGTKIAANASKDSVKTAEHLESKLEELNKAIETLEKEWDENERQEQKMFGDKSSPWIEPSTPKGPKRLEKWKVKKEKIAKALNEIKKREENCPRKMQQVNSTTDPESRVMKGKKGGSRPCMNVQVASDSKAGISTAAEGSSDPNDSGYLVPMVEASAKNCGRQHDAAAADTAYNTGPDLKELEEQGVTTYLPEGNGRKTELSATAREALKSMKEGQELTEEQSKALVSDPEKKKLPRELFSYDAERDEYECPAGGRLHQVGRNTKKQTYGTVQRTIYGGCSACATCCYALLCLNKGMRERRIYRDEYEEYRERLRTRMATDEGKEQYKQRMHLAETPFAFILENLGIRQFLHRGGELTDLEWKLANAAMNIRTLMGRSSQVVPVLTAK